MTHDMAKEFVDSATHEDCVCRLYGYLYFCYGLTWNEDKGLYSLLIDKYRSLYPETDFVETVLDVEAPRKEECMTRFLEDRIWGGKSFWEAAPDMEWTDYAGEP